MVCKNPTSNEISFIENQVVWHHKLPSEEEYNNAIHELNIQLENFK